MSARRWRAPVHELKCLPQHYGAVADGAKRAEIRKDDRGFAAGDSLRLREWNGADYTGREITATISHVLRAGEFEGLAPGYCMLSLDLSGPQF